MSQNFEAGQPGILSTSVATPRRILFGGDAMPLPGGVVIDGALSRDLSQPLVDQGILQAGKLLGKITASGKYAVAIIGALAIAHDTSATPAVVTVGVPIATEYARMGITTISFTGPAVAATAPVNVEQAVVDSIDTGAGTITLTGALTNDFAIGSWVGPGNGAETPRLMVDSDYGVRVVDNNQVSVDVDLSDPLMGGMVATGQIIDYTADAVIQEFLKTTLRVTVRTLFTFDDDFV